MNEAYDRKVFEVARLRNLSMQRQLSTKLSVISREREHARDRIALEQRMLRLQLREMKPKPKPEGNPQANRRSVVLPRGLTAEQKAMFLTMKAEKPASISLVEFEDRLSEWKKRRELDRYELLQEREKEKRKKTNFTKISIHDLDDDDDDDDQIYVTSAEALQNKVRNLSKGSKKRRRWFVRTCCVSKNVQTLTKSATTIF